jgi:hypothetical protein
VIECRVDPGVHRDDAPASGRVVANRGQGCGERVEDPRVDDEVLLDLLARGGRHFSQPSRALRFLAARQHLPADRAEDQDR